MKINKILIPLLTLTLLTACTPPPKTDPGTTTHTPTETETHTQTETLAPGNFTDLPLTIPEDMRLDYLVKDLSGARVIEGPDAQGNFWVSRTKEGIISMIELDAKGEVGYVEDVLKELNKPHGLAFDPQNPSVLYYAEADKISRVDILGEFVPVKLVDLPKGGRHFTRTLMFGPDERLYISIGSSCDVCKETDERYASIYSMNKDGSDFKPYATGLRNAVFMETEPIQGDIWVTEMGRDGLGDNLPPDEINILKEGGDYGWPYCYGKNVKDETFGGNETCDDKVPSHLDLKAHSAPLGLAFVPEEGWPEAYWNDLLVAYHGSLNLKNPTGYSVVHIELDDEGNEVKREPFIEGWLSEGGKVLGRPVDFRIFPGGTMYITDDERGAVYRLRWVNPQI